MDTELQTIYFQFRLSVPEMQVAFNFAFPLDRDSVTASASARLSAASGLHRLRLGAGAPSCAAALGAEPSRPAA